MHKPSEKCLPLIVHPIYQLLPVSNMFFCGSLCINKYLYMHICMQIYSPPASCIIQVTSSLPPPHPQKSDLKC